ncbi:serine hydrolase domain-containing protein [Nocardia yamanashiensis]|uniref:serine hydrolase domain-containing protein n=1 Tax=Nocardia yamanashiensis TaxID=209247 RepID=UPI00082EA8F5|nr:serine hydrolase [Nocardia yamanashiensis]
MRLHRTSRAAALGIAAFAALSLTAAPAPAEPADSGACAEPEAGKAFERRDAGAAGMDAAAVTDALDFGQRAGGYAVQVYRHGCLIGERTPTGNLPLPLASASKGVASLAVGRAITLGYFGVDDPLVRFFPQADAAHANLTVRQVLTQSTGLHFSWPADIAGIQTDEVLQSLASPAEYEPGTTFQYAQSVLALLPKIIEISTGLDYQEFVQRELMGPLGIDRENWIWLRDRSGNTAVNGGLAMRPADLARIGNLMLHNGSWRGQQLIDADYLREATTPSPANAGYGFLMWLNAGDSYRGVDVPTATLYEHSVFTGSPRDTYAFSGALGQFVVVVPSRDLVIVRLGVPAKIEIGNLQALLTGTSNPDNKELFRRLSAAVTDVPGEPYDDPYRYPAPSKPLAKDLGELARLLDPVNAAQILLGVGPYASTGCNLLWCNGKPVPVDVFKLLLDVGGQVLAAAQGLGNTPR